MSCESCAIIDRQRGRMAAASFTGRRAAGTCESVEASGKKTRRSHLLLPPDHPSCRRPTLIFRRAGSVGPRPPRASLDMANHGSLGDMHGG